MREGQHVNAGDELFEIDPRPFQLARRRRRKAKLDTVRTDFDNLKSNLQVARPRSPTWRRRTSSSSSATSTARPRWLTSRAGSQADVDTADGRAW